MLQLRLWNGGGAVAIGNRLDKEYDPHFWQRQRWKVPAGWTNARRQREYLRHHSEWRRGRCGVLFELSLAGGVWNESILDAFNNGTGGGYPFSGVVLDGLGNIYGQTNSGGIPGDCSDFLGCGVVYEVTQ